MNKTKPGLLSRLFGSDAPPTPQQVDAKIVACQADIARLTAQLDASAQALGAAYGDAEATQEAADQRALTQSLLIGAQAALTTLLGAKEEALDNAMLTATKAKADQAKQLFSDAQRLRVTEFAETKAAFESAAQRLNTLENAAAQATRELPDALISRRDSFDNEADRQRWAQRPAVREAERLIEDARRTVNL